MSIIQNRSLGHAVISDTSNANYILTEFAVPSSSIETVTNIAITKIFWTGDWTIKRANVIVFQTANNTGVWDLNASGIALTSGNTAANLTVNTTSTSASIVLGISKTSFTTANTY